jgi:hypothetical protein
MSDPSYQSDRIVVELQYATAVIAQELKSIRESISTRPDRIGDECWYGTWVTGEGWSWHRGILRAWVPGDCPAVVEDVEAKKVDCYSMISFSTEAPA